MSLDYNAAQESFNNVLCKLHPWVLSNFIMWLDLKIAEYKVFGQIVTDKEKGNVTCLDNQTWSAVQRSRERLRETQKSQVQKNIESSENPSCQILSDENASSNNGKSSLQNIKYNDLVKGYPESSNSKLKHETEQHRVNIDNEHQVPPQKRLPQILSSSSEIQCRNNMCENRENSENYHEDRSQKEFVMSENIQKQTKIHRLKAVTNHNQAELLSLDTDEDSKDEDEFCLSNVSISNSADDTELTDIDQQFKEHIQQQNNIRVDQNLAVKPVDDGCGSCIKLQSQIDGLQNWMKKLEGSLFSKPDTTKASSCINQTTPAESAKDQRTESRPSSWQTDTRGIVTEPLVRARQEDMVLTDEEQTDSNFISSKRNLSTKKNKLSQNYHLDTGKPPRAGVLTQKIAAKWQMVELQTGSSVYIHYQQWINAVAKDPTKAACYLMSCFWRKEDLKGMTLTGVRNSRRLNPEIVHTIINFCLSKPGGSGKLAEIKRAMRNKIGDSGRVRSVLQSQQRSSSQGQPSIINELNTTPPENIVWQQSHGCMNISPQSESYCVSTNEDSLQGVVTHNWNQDDDQGAQPQQTMYLREEDVNIVVKHEPNQDYL